MFQDQRRLRECEDNRNRHDPEHFESDPEFRALRAPDNFVDQSEDEEKQAPAEGELFPALVGQFQNSIKDDSEEGFFEDQSADENGAEQAVDDRWLHLDEGFVMQPQCQSAKDHNNEGGDDGHDWEVACQRVGDGERGDHGNHENAGRCEEVSPLVRDEKNDQGPHFKREPNGRMKPLSRGRWIG